MAQIADVNIINADAVEGLRQIGDNTISTIVTSPPYYGLRDYGEQGQIGLEDTPEEYVERLTDVFREARRALAPDGTLWINIGDSYATSKGSYHPPTNTRNRHGHAASRVPPGYKPKDLIGIPWMLAFALRSDGWHLRQDIIWNKPNAMPESVRDRCTRSHEHIFLLAKRALYFFDADAIREPFTAPIRAGERRSYKPGSASSYNMDGGHAAQHGNFAGLPLNPNGRNKRDVWHINTAAYKDAHFATFPKELARLCVLAGSRPGDRVLDMFCGSGTTGVVAIQEGRQFTGIDISLAYTKMAAQRIENEAAQAALFDSAGTAAMLGGAQ